MVHELEFPESVRQTLGARRDQPSLVATLLEQGWPGSPLVVEPAEAEAIKPWARASGALLRPLGEREWHEAVLDLRVTAPWGIWMGVEWHLDSDGVELNGLRSWCEGTPEEASDALLALAAERGMEGFPFQWPGLMPHRKLLGRCLLQVAPDALDRGLGVSLGHYRRCYAVLQAVERAASRTELLAAKVLQHLQAQRIGEALRSLDEIETLEALCRDLDSWPGPWTPWAERARKALGRCWPA